MPVSTDAPPARRRPEPSPNGREPEDARGRQVVVGVDGSRISSTAVRWAAAEAAARHAPLRIVHAATYLGRPPSPGAGPPELPRARRITAQAYTVGRHTAPWTPISTEIVPTGAVRALLDATEGSQLLVLGSSTTGAPDELVLASLTQRVAARSACAVISVPRSHSDDTRAPVVAVLGLPWGAADEGVAGFAAAAAERAGRPLRLLETRDDGRDPSWWAERLPRTDVQHRTVPDAAAVDILTAAGTRSLLVLPTGRPGIFERSLDGLHRWLLRHSTSPVALLPSPRVQHQSASS